MRRFRQGVWTIILLGMGVTLPAGCPIATPVSQTDPGADGDYWVDVVDGRVSFFNLSAYRGDDGRWARLDVANTAWFVGPGMYRFDSLVGWRPIAESPIKSLDELLQIHDPPPRAVERE